MNMPAPSEESFAAVDMALTLMVRLERLACIPENKYSVVMRMKHQRNEAREDDDQLTANYWQGLINMVEGQNL